jgi:uncharacterized membrane protein
MMRGTLAQIAAQSQERGYEWGWGMHPMMGLWGAWGAVMMLMVVLFWGVVIAGLVLGIRWLLRQGSRPPYDSGSTSSASATRAARSRRKSSRR